MDILLHETKGHPRQFQKDEVSLSFGNLVIPKLLANLCSDDSTVRIKSLHHLSSLFHQPFHVAEALHEDAIAFLVGMLSTEKDQSILFLITESIKTISNQAVSHPLFLQSPLLTALFAALTTFPDASSRLNLYLCLQNLCRTSKGSVTAIEAGIIPLFIQKLRTETPYIESMRSITTSFYSLALHGPDPCLHHKILDVLMPLLAHETPDLRLTTIRILLALSKEKDGKILLIPFIPHLLTGLCSETDDPVTLSLLMNIVNEKKGKAMLVGEGGVDTLLNVFASSHSDTVLLILLQIFTILARYPPARVKLSPEIESFRKISQDQEKSLHFKKTAQLCVTVLETIA